MGNERPESVTGPHRPVMVAHLRRYSIRLHFGLIVLASLCAGLASEELLRWLGLTAPLLRWPLAVIGSAGGFVAGVTLWRAYVVWLVERGAIHSPADLNRPPGRFVGAWTVGGNLSGTGVDDIVGLVLVLALYLISLVLWLPASLCLYALARGSLALFQAVFAAGPVPGARPGRGERGTE